MRFTVEDIDTSEVARRKALYGPLTEVVRELIDATIRTEVDDDTIREVHAQVRAATDRLRARQSDGPFGVRFTNDGDGMAWGNAVIGLRNAIAPPLTIARDPDGTHRSQFVLGAAYEGPPGLVHGGICALVLDQILGMTALAGDKPSFTGTLTLRFRRSTPLGPLRAQARVDRVEGVKTFVVGSLSDADGVTVEAEGVFILPAWARE
ncbi:PaaI family thioesterase [Rhodococcus spelaei]|uniref:Acyl-coenzyme A thioesterase THEM4 n=1 Tax=Rhodococcus spelaei TaxID=2546320 RepID=A0A541B7C7_9NOCA|nr:PaaI family thioesterase [Rhodococcus spelaei]TQF68232.1 PaaI family thioesterase [Rhodococcus spelaei]